MGRKLREILDEIMQRKSWVQVELANYVGVKQPTISKMRQSEDWDLHWQTFLKLLPLCSELKINLTARKLDIADAEKEGQRYVEQEVDTKTGKAHSERKRRHKKKIIGAISARGASGD